MSTKICLCSFCGAELVRKSAPSIKTKAYFCNLDCKSQQQRKAKPVSEAWLREHYIDKELDCVQIAHMVKRDPKSVWNWMKDFGIPMRPRGNPLATRGTRIKKGDQLFKGRKHTPEYRKRMSDYAKSIGRVPYDPAVGSYMKGRKGADCPNWRGGVTPERQAFYSTKEWKSVSRKVKKRDGNSCQRCGRVKVRGDGVEFDIHHIVSFAYAPLRCVESNLVYLCEQCHYWIHSNENENKQFVLEAPSDS